VEFLKVKMLAWINPLLGNLVSVSVYMSMAITKFVAMKMLGSSMPVGSGSFTAVWHWTMVSMIGMEVVIYMPVEVSRSMKPRACPDEDTTPEPLRSIIAVRSTGIRGNIIIAVRTYWSRSDVNTDLSISIRRVRRDTDSANNCQRKMFKSVHNSPMFVSGVTSASQVSVWDVQMETLSTSYRMIDVANCAR
jgi:hypothetical protein